MKKLLMVVVAVAVFVLLVFLTGQQKNNIDQSVSISSTDMDKTDSKTSQKNNPEKNNLTKSTSNSEKSNPSAKKLEPEIQQALEKMLNTSSEGLVEEKTNQGVSVNLQGRFQTVPVATINEKGEAEIQDYSSVPPAQGRK